MAEITCPWCFGVFRDLEIQFRCINTRCGRVPDHEYSAYYGLPSDKAMPVVVDPKEGLFASLTGQETERVPCTGCGVETSKKVCPLCHNELPDTVGKYRHCILAIVGSKESGKSHYIAVLLKSLEQEIGAKLDASLIPLNDATIDRYQRQFHDPIFRGRVVLDATKSVSRHADGKVPLIFCLKLRRKGLLGERFEVITLVFFDTAGEDLDDVDLMQVETKYIGRSDGIVFLVDPLQIPAIRGRLPGAVLPDTHTAPDVVVGKLARVIRRVRGLDIGEPITTPLAFTISKLDVLKPLLPRGSVLLEPSAHGTEFDPAEFERVDREVRARLVDWLADSGSMVRQVEHEFATHGFFAASALGESPRRDGTLPPGVAPFRVADPLLWLLWKRGLIEGRSEG